MPRKQKHFRFHSSTFAEIAEIRAITGWNDTEIAETAIAIALEVAKAAKNGFEKDLSGYTKLLVKKPRVLPYKKPVSHPQICKEIRSPPRNRIREMLFRKKGGVTAYPR